MGVAGQLYCVNNTVITALCSAQNETHVTDYRPTQNNIGPKTVEASGEYGFSCAIVNSGGAP